MNQQSAKTPPIAIIGMSCLFPQAGDVREYWSNILAGRDAIADVPPTHWRHEEYFNSDPSVPDHTYGKRGGFLSPVDFPPLEFGITPKSLEATDTTQLLGLLVAKGALEDAGYHADREFDRNRTSVILGVTGTLPLVIPLGARLGHPIWRKALKNAGVPEDVAEKVVAEIADGYVGWQEDSFPGLLGNVVAGRIANRLNLGGTNCVVDAACASSLSALHLAMMELETGRSDMALTGGMDTFNDIFMYMCFSKTPALSPTGDAKPFSADADGTILGEGLGCIVLKRLADAERNGDKIYAVIRGIGTSSDGKGNAIYAPSSHGQTKALRQAYRLAGISADTIELVEAHGTGTKAGDTAEVTALTEVYRDARREGKWCALGSVKSQIGHTKSAAGAAGLMKAALALYHKSLPPTIKVTAPIDTLAGENSPFYVNGEKRPWMAQPNHPRRAAVSSFGFGGSNYHCVLEEYHRDKSSVDWDGNVQIVAISAASRDELRRKLGEWRRSLLSSPGGEGRVRGSWDEIRRFAASSRREFHIGDPFRMTVVLRQDRDVANIITRALDRFEQSANESSWSLPEGAYFGAGGTPGKLALLFPGQGSQYPGMGRDLACQFPEMMAALAVANESARQGKRGLLHAYLSDAIFPFSAFSEEERQRQIDALRATDVAQPAIGAVSVGMLTILRHFGVRAKAVAGHSFGELTALHAAGRFTSSDFLKMAVARGRLMAEISGGAGGMLAVNAAAETISNLLERENLNIVIANHNAPQQTVVSGSLTELERAGEVFAAAGVASRQLPVGAAFHSPLVADVAGPFGAALRATPVNGGSLPVYANTTGQPYPEDIDRCRDMLAQQLAKPVRFHDLIGNMYDDGVRVFVEVGPGNVLSGLVGAILPDRDHQRLAVDGSRGKQPGAFDLARVLSHLAALGYAVDLMKWEEGNEPPVATEGNAKLTVELSGANYRSDKIFRREGEAPAEPFETASRQEPRPPNNDGPAIPPAQVAKPIRTVKTDFELEKRLRPAVGEVAAGNGEFVNEGHYVSEHSISALKQITEQTAELHRQFLQGQERALEVLQALLHHESGPAQTNGSVKAPPAIAESPMPPRPIVEQRRLTDRALPVETVEEPPPESAPIVPQSPEPVTTRTETVTTLIDIVAEKTGYPPEMLNLDMEMDADLGIDSIKKVEIFSALQEQLPEAPAMQSEQLGELRTLRDVVVFLGASEPQAASNIARRTELHSVSVSATLLQIIADKTGYPPEMLELDMEMDADLGIDSIKKVEIFSALQEQLPQLGEIKGEQLGALHKIRDVVDFLSDNVSDGQQPLADSKPNSADHVDSPAQNADCRTELHSVSVNSTLLQIVADKTGYPPEMLELDMEMDADLGIDSIKKVEIFSALQEQLPDLPQIPGDGIGSLRTLRQVLDYLNGKNIGSCSPGCGADDPAVDSSPDTAITDQPSTETTVLSELQVQRYLPKLSPISESSERPCVSLPADGEILIIDEPSELAKRIAERLNLLGYTARIVAVENLQADSLSDKTTGAIFLAPTEGTTDGYLQRAFAALQCVSAPLRRSNGVLMTVSRLDGGFGFSDGVPLADPLSGGLAGLVKTARWEWPKVSCKAVDASPVLDAEESALAIVAELFLNGPVEVGIGPEGTFAVELVESAPQGVTEMPLGQGDVVVITGGARGVTAEVALALARNGQPTLILFGRSPLASAEPDWLAALAEERDIKQALVRHAQSPQTPKELQEEYQRIAAGREIRRNLDRLRETGAAVHYRQVDVRDGHEVNRVCREIRDQFGSIAGVVHGAGVLADKKIEDKTAEQFQRVYETKVVGLRNLLTAVQKDPLRVLALFSSSTGRFGRAGQVDYAVANEALNKRAQAEARQRPDCKVVAFNWGPWAGGMVTPALERLFAKERLTPISLEAGGRFFVEEISRSGNTEVVVLGEGSVLPQEERTLVDATPARARNAKPVDDSDEDRMPLPVAFSRQVSLETIPVLQDHVLGGRAVVPVVLMIEWFAHGAMHGHPGLQFCGFDELRVFRGIKLGEEDEITVDICAGAGRMARLESCPTNARLESCPTNGSYRVPVELRNRAENGERIRYAAGTVLLDDGIPEAPQPGPIPKLESWTAPISEIYNDYLFHGPAFQGIASVEGMSVEGIAGSVRCATPPREWFQHPLRGRWLAEPLVLDSAFQLMVLWTRMQQELPSLPVSIRRYRQYRRTFPRDGMRVVVRVTDQVAGRATADMDFFDAEGALVARMQGYECVMDASLHESYRANRLPVLTGAGG